MTTKPRIMSSSEDVSKDKEWMERTVALDYLPYMMHHCDVFRSRRSLSILMS